MLNKKRKQRDDTGAPFKHARAEILRKTGLTVRIIRTAFVQGKTQYKFMYGAKKPYFEFVKENDRNVNVIQMFLSHLKEEKLCKA